MAGAFRIEETVWITLSDGCRLAARLWLPSGEAGPVPVILEYLPYRRRDRHRGDDAILHPAFAAAGYAAIRVDMRGAGDSDGTMTDEYTAREWDDAVEVIDWIARQKWCSGAVGMIGLSWSGFNSLQVAAKAPPALKAIVTTCASDDRYADDMHYMGGCLLNDNLQYGATLFTWLATPPDPAIVGARWRDMWLERLAVVEPPAARWMRHSDRNAYWRSGSVCEDYGAIKAAVLAVGGWADGYTNAVLRLLEGLPGPRKGLIGPWGHAFPHVATPGPRIDFLGYVLRWWDHWLKGHDTGIMDEPMLTAWMQESEAPRPRYAERRGRWIAEPLWPSPQVAPKTLHLTATGLADEASAVERSVRSPATTGLASGEWCPYGWGPDMPTDQREDDAGSLCFDGPPLEAPLQLLGGARVTLELSSDRPEAMVAVRLNDVAPDGMSARITYGLLNLQHRDGHAEARPLVPGRCYRVEVRLNDAAYEIPAGHRLRVAVSTAYWPLTVTAPVGATVTVHGGALHLPVRTEGPDAVGAPDLGRAWSPPPLDAEILVPPARGRVQMERHVEDGRTSVRVVRNLGALRIADVDLELKALGSETYSTVADEPGQVRSEADRCAEFRRGDWQASVVTRSVLTVDGSDWRLIATLDAHEGEARVFARSWDLRIPRSLAPAEAPAAQPRSTADHNKSRRKQQGKLDMSNHLKAISRRGILKGAGAAATLALLPSPLKAADAVTVGWTTDTEQSILGNMTALVLEKKLGIAVGRVGNLGGTGIAHQAIIDGAIGIYPDYTGDALANVLKQEPITEPMKAWEAVRDGYAEAYQITWLKPTPFNNTYALALKEATAEEFGISTISDLSAKAGEWTLGCSVEFAGRPIDGYPGMVKHYGFDFGSVKPMDVGLMYTAIDGDQVDVIVAFATDARIGKVGLRVLTDDKFFFPSYNAAITVRDEVLSAHPEIREAVEAVTDTLDTPTQIRLNGRSDIDGVPPETVAEDYLKEIGAL